MPDNNNLLKAYAQRLIARHIRELQACRAGVVRGEDREYLHRFRVCLRRTDNLLKIFREIFPKKFLHKARRVIIHTARALGPARDLDIASELLRCCGSRLGKSHAKDVQIALQILKKERQLLQQDVRKALDYFEKNNQLECLLVEKNAACSRTNKDQLLHVTGSCSYPARARFSLREKQILWPWVQEKIFKKTHKLSRAFVYVPQASQSKRLHNLRISLKKARYMLESFASFDRRTIQQYAQMIRAIQTALGQMRDGENFIVFLKTNRNFLARTPGVFRTLLKKFFEKEKQKAFQQFFQLYQKNKREQTWQALRRWAQTKQF